MTIDQKEACKDCICPEAGKSPSVDGVLGPTVTLSLGQFVRHAQRLGHTRRNMPKGTARNKET